MLRLLQEKSRSRDRIIHELNQNNIKLKTPISQFWDISRYILKNSKPIRKEFEHIPEWRRMISENTVYLLLNNDEQLHEPVYRTVNPVPVPDDIPIVFGNLVSSKDQFGYLAMNSCMKKETAKKLERLFKRNIEILIELCAMDLEARIGQDFKGLYAHAKFDVDMPYKLGGKWLLIEPDCEDYEKDVMEYTELGKIGLSEGRIKLSTSPILVGGKSSQLRRPSYQDSMIRNYSPDILMIKLPTPGAKYEELLSFYKRFLQRNTLIISDTELDEPGLTLVSDLIGIDGLNELKTESTGFGSGGDCSELTKFRFYTH